MKQILIFLAFVTSAAACNSGYTSIVDPFLNPDGSAWTGAITYTLAYNTTVAGATIVGAKQNINIINGMSLCLAPGLYSPVTLQQSGQRNPITTSWGVPAAPGPYTYAQIAGAATIGSMQGIVWSATAFTSATSVSIPAGQFGSNIVVICSGVAECGSVNVSSTGAVTVGFLTPQTGTVYVGGGTAYTAEFTSAATVSVPFTSLQTQIALLGCYDTGGYQFGAGNLNTPAFDSGIGGGQGVNYLLDLGTPNQSGRCVFLQGAQQ